MLYHLNKNGHAFFGLCRHEITDVFDYIADPVKEMQRMLAEKKFVLLPHAQVSRIMGESVGMYQLANQMEHFKEAAIDNNAKKELVRLDPYFRYMGEAAKGHGEAWHCQIYQLPNSFTSLKTAFEEQYANKIVDEYQTLVKKGVIDSASKCLKRQKKDDPNHF